MLNTTQTLHKVITKIHHSTPLPGFDSPAAPRESTADVAELRRRLHVEARLTAVREAKLRVEPAYRRSHERVERGPDRPPATMQKRMLAKGSTVCRLNVYLLHPPSHCLKRRNTTIALRTTPGDTWKHDACESLRWPHNYTSVLYTFTLH